MNNFTWGGNGGNSKATGHGAETDEERARLLGQQKGLGVVLIQGAVEPLMRENATDVVQEDKIASALVDQRAKAGKHVAKLLEINNDVVILVVPLQALR